jgi:hypothetical protein
MSSYTYYVDPCQGNAGGQRGVEGDMARLVSEGSGVGSEICTISLGCDDTSMTVIGVMQVMLLLTASWNFEVSSSLVRWWISALLSNSAPTGPIFPVGSFVQ